MNNNESFTSLMECFKLLPIQNKRIEVIDKIELMISEYSALCIELGKAPIMNLNRQMLNLNRDEITENEVLDGLFAYINALQDINSQVINILGDYIEANKNE